MCGKFTQMATWSQVVAFSAPLDTSGDLTTSTPMRFARVICLDDAGARVNLAMRWGFADKRAANPHRPKHMHARAETIDKLPTFAESFARRRGILLVHTFNEGEELPNGKTKQWVITPKDAAPLALAVIYEEWRHGDESLLTFIQITVPANKLIAPVTDRMPAMLAPQDWEIWLGETSAPLDEVKALLRTYEDDGAWEIAPQAPAAKPVKRRDAESGEMF